MGHLEVFEACSRQFSTVLLWLLSGAKFENSSALSIIKTSVETDSEQPCDALHFYYIITILVQIMIDESILDL